MSAPELPSLSPTATLPPATDYNTFVVPLMGHHPDIVCRAREELDEEISQLQQNICALRARRNGLSPVACLPVELLAEIFILNATANQDLNDHDGDLTWLNVAHVCQHWRSVALQTPRIWTRIDVRSADWVSLQLERSRTLPFVAHVDFRGKSSHSRLRATELLAQHASRLQAFKVTSSRFGPATSCLWNNLTYPAPLLQSFVLHRADRDIAQGNSNTLYHVPHELFGGETPSLRHVELHQCTWCWQTSLFSSTITQLVLDGRGTWIRTSPQEILGALVRMPLLERLELEQIMPHVPWDFIPRMYSTSPVELPRLNFLRIGALALNCANILYNLSFPLNTQTVLQCHIFRSHHEFGTLGSTIAHRFRCNATPLDEEVHLQSLTFKPISNHVLHIAGWTSALSPEVLPSLGSEATLSLYMEADGMSLNENIRNLVHTCRTLPLENVRALHVPAFVSLSTRAWLQIFGAMDRLETLWVVGRTASNLPNALRKEVECECTVDGHPNGDQGEHVHGRAPALFPMLRLLTFEDVDFTASSCPDASFFWQLQDFVMERRKHQSEVKIRIFRCRNFIVEQMHDLKLVGGQVEWSGEELLDFDLRDIDSDDSEEDYEDFYDN